MNKHSLMTEAENILGKDVKDLHRDLQKKKYTLSLFNLLFVLGSLFVIAFFAGTQTAGVFNLLPQAARFGTQTGGLHLFVPIPTHTLAPPTLTPQVPTPTYPPNTVKCWACPAGSNQCVWDPGALYENGVCPEGTHKKAECNSICALKGATPTLMPSDTPPPGGGSNIYTYRTYSGAYCDKYGQLRQDCDTENQCPIKGQKCENQLSECKAGDVNFIGSCCLDPETGDYNPCGGVPPTATLVPGVPTPTKNPNATAAPTVPAANAEQCGTNDTCGSPCCTNWGVGGSKPGCGELWQSCKAACGGKASPSGQAICGGGGGPQPTDAPPAYCVKNGQSGCSSPSDCCNSGGGCNGGCCGHCGGGGGGGGGGCNFNPSSCDSYPCQNNDPYCAENGQCKCSS